MQPTQTGIATALALVVVIMFFIIPGLWPFQDVASVSEGDVAGAVTSDQTTSSTSMPTDLTQVTELMMRDDVVGAGAVAEAGDTVTVHYVGSLTDGTVFDASRPRGDAGFSFALGAGQGIKGRGQGEVGP